MNIGHSVPRGSTDQTTAQLPTAGKKKRTTRTIRSVSQARFLRFIGAASLVAVMLAAVAFVAVGGDSHEPGTIPPNVFAAGADIGDLTTDEASQVLDTALAEYRAAPAVFRFDGQEWSPTAEELGVSFNIDRTVSEAQASPDFWERLSARFSGHTDRDVPIYITLDRGVLDQYVADLAIQIDQDPSVPELVFVDDQVDLSEAVDGRTVRQDELASSVEDAVAALSRAELDVPVDSVDVEYSSDEVASVSETLTYALAEPTTIVFEDKSWQVEPDVLKPLVRLELNADAPAGERIRIGFHEADLEEHVLSLMTGQVYREAKNATVAWGGSGIVATSESQTGVELDLPTLMENLTQALVAGERTVELPVHTVEPEISSNDLGALGIDELIATGESAFWNSSPSRANNIAVAASYLDGTLIAPGEEFSFNNSIGQISVDRGYEEGYVILAEETVPGIGGGVCQVSTTMFRAAFFSGLPITERNPHAYLVGYYEEGGWPLGFDAAIFQPGADFRFANTTDSYILVHTQVTDGKIYVNMYGTHLGYDVQLHDAVITNEQDPPADVEVVDETLAPGARQQVEWAKPGMDVTLQRTVTKGGEVVREDHFFSRFQAWGNRFLVGPEPQPTPTVDPEESEEPDETQAPESTEAPESPGETAESEDGESTE